MGRRRNLREKIPATFRAKQQFSIGWPRATWLDSSRRGEPNGGGRDLGLAGGIFRLATGRRDGGGGGQSVGGGGEAEKLLVCW
ncbi:UNVERIFIED_CONTAM: hypothetical protein Sindi_2501100 [Sesamum indicum]